MNPLRQQGQPLNDTEAEAELPLRRQGMQQRANVDVRVSRPYNAYPPSVTAVEGATFGRNLGDDCPVDRQRIDIAAPSLQTAPHRAVGFEQEMTSAEIQAGWDVTSLP